MAKNLGDIKGKNVLIRSGVFHTRAGNVRLDEWKYKPKVREIDKAHPFNCGRLYGMLHILHDGTIIPCCMDWNIEHPLGNIKDYEIEEVFHLDTYKDFIEMMRGRKESPDNFICKRCDWPEPI